MRKDIETIDMEYEFKRIIEKQREFFFKGDTFSVEFRIKQLKKLKEFILNNEVEILEALKKDLGKSYMEGYMSEISLVLNEINYMIKNIKKLSKDKKVKTGIVQFPCKSYVRPMPYGVTLIIGSYNYPFLLTIQPMIDSLAAGNTVILKPSEFALATKEVIAKMILDLFPSEYVTVVNGGEKESICLLEQKFDYIFFTGSKRVGEQVLKQASKYITPVTLELGGKSPCIVDSTAKIDAAAKSIVFGKFLNCGQTCIAPDYILCDEKIKEELIYKINIEIKKQFGEYPLDNDNYGRIINDKHFERIESLIERDKVVFGGKSNKESLKIEPTVMDNVTFDDNVMKEEIFGPILPILTYKNIKEVIGYINRNEKPLALYLFSNDKNNKKTITTYCIYGGGCINDVITHISVTNMGFGGVGESGMGSYHGKSGFETFSHKKGIVDKYTIIDLPIRYQPYKPVYYKIIKKIFK